MAPRGLKTPLIECHAKNISTDICVLAKYAVRKIQHK
jgi:hypothetical protein